MRVNGLRLGSSEATEPPHGPCVPLLGQGGREREQPRLAIRDWCSVSSPSRLARSS
eukprot:superscaffoldBa00006163_g21211